MLRNVMLGVAAAAAIGFGASAASAAPPIVIQPSSVGFPQPQFDRGRHDHDYAVLVRHGRHWHEYGRYETRWQAERAERFLESRGRQARIEVIHDHR